MQDGPRVLNVYLRLRRFDELMSGSKLVALLRFELPPVFIRLQLCFAGIPFDIVRSLGRIQFIAQQLGQIRDKWCHRIGFFEELSLLFDGFDLGANHPGIGNTLCMVRQAFQSYPLGPARTNAVCQVGPGVDALGQFLTPSVECQ